MGPCHICCLGALAVGFLFRKRAASLFAVFVCGELHWLARCGLARAARRAVGGCRGRSAVDTFTPLQARLGVVRRGGVFIVTSNFARAVFFVLRGDRGTLGMLVSRLYPAFREKLPNNSSPKHTKLYPRRYGYDLKLAWLSVLDEVAVRYSWSGLCIEGATYKACQWARFTIVFSWLA